MSLSYRHRLWGLVLAAMHTAVFCGAAAAGEAPALAAMVAAGDLPPLEERLPSDPRVLEPIDSVGVYGGVWRTGSRESAETWTMRTAGYDHMFNWNTDWTGVVPNIVADYAMNEDATEYTFTLREGMKWSDGEPFTADDLIFASEVWEHPDLAAHPAYMQSEDGPGTVEKVDDITVRIAFPSPNVTFLDGMASVTTAIGGDAFTKYPQHYMMQFHADHATDLEAAVQAAGVSSWQELFELRSDTWLNPDKPTLNAWRVVTPYGEGSRVVVERNPYYWKVDPEGNQLPYIDRIVYEVLQDFQVLLLKALAGELDMHGEHINTPENKSVLFDGQEAGDYRFYELKPADANLANYAFNQAHKDPVLREVLGNKNFRAGLSHAINRQEIIDLVFIGQAMPFQTAILPEYEPLYNEQLATQYLEYDVDKANALLDEAGYAERDAAGLRLGPDGNPIRFALLTRSDKTYMADIGQMVVGYWREVGVDARVDVVERSLVRSRKDANDHDVIVEDFSAGKRDAMLSPTQYIPVNHNSAYGIPWFDWWRGQGGEEPPEHVRAQLETWAKISTLSDEEERFALMREILQVSADSFYNIGIAAPLSSYGIVSNRMKNVPESMEKSFWFAPPGPWNPPTFYFVDGQT